jgi:DNA-binding response OmpR family regulator
MDRHMPAMDGYEAARRIREHEKSTSRSGEPTTPLRIIAMTANAKQGDREKYLAAGMDDYLGKPVRTEELKSALDRWAPRSRSIAPTRKSTSLPALIDQERVKEISQNKEQFQRWLKTFFAQALEDIVKNRPAIESGEYKAARHLAHKSAGTAASLGLTGVAEPMHLLERRALDGDLSDAP